MAAAIGEVNAKLKAEGRKFLLMAPGRWGSADARRGIPVDWHAIDGSAFIVETALKGPEFVPLSQVRVNQRMCREARVNPNPHQRMCREARVKGLTRGTPYTARFYRGDGTQKGPNASPSRRFVYIYI